MAQGSKWDEEIKQNVKLLLAINTPTREISEQLNVPDSTIRVWKADWNNDGSLAELKRRKKEELEDRFIKEAQEVMELATKRVKETLKDASAAQAATIYGIYTDKARLFQGETTSNVGQQGLTIMIGQQVVTGDDAKKTINQSS